MKTKTYILTFFIFLSGVVLGQKEFYDDNLDDDFLEFREKVLVEKLRLDIEPIKPTDTIQLIDTNIRVIENYKLKYVHIVPDILLHKGLMDMDRYTKFGTDFIVINLTGYPTRPIYYYEIIRKEDEKFLKANVTTYNLNDTIVPIRTNTIEFKDYGNDVENNISLINKLNILDFVLTTEHKWSMCCANCEAMTRPMSSIAFFAIIKKDNKGNFVGISRCGHNNPYIPLEEDLEKQLEYRYSFKYDLSDKLSEIKVREHLYKLYKIEWL